MELYLDAETFGIFVANSILGAIWNLNKIIAKELNSVSFGILFYLATLKSRCEKHGWVKLRQALPSALWGGFFVGFLFVWGFFYLSKKKNVFPWGKLKINSGQFCKEIQICFAWNKEYI